MNNPHHDWQALLYEFREQGMQITDINPISALSDVICDQLYDGKLTRTNLQQCLNQMGSELWNHQCQRLRQQTGVNPGIDQADPDLDTINLDAIDLSAPLYRAVFTAHPVFALRPEASMALCENAESGTVKLPNDAYAVRTTVSLNDEHNEAMAAIHNARIAIKSINDAILKRRQTSHAGEWRETLPQILGVSTWVGYDLDGRSDIGWADSFRLRLAEKAQALKQYIDALSDHATAASLADKLQRELSATDDDISRFDRLDSSDDFAATMNALTERSDKLVSSYAIADELHDIARSVEDDDEARHLLVIAADMRTHGFGMAEIHLRINAVQLRNAMRSVDGRSITTSDGMVSTRSLIERLSARIQSEAPWKINFKNLIMRRQLHGGN